MPRVAPLAHATCLALSHADMVLAMPLRKAPPAHIVSAVVGPDDPGVQDEAPARLPVGAYPWEAAVEDALRTRQVMRCCWGGWSGRG